MTTMIEGIAIEERTYIGLDGEELPLIRRHNLNRLLRIICPVLASLTPQDRQQYGEFLEEVRDELAEEWVYLTENKIQD